MGTTLETAVALLACYKGRHRARLHAAAQHRELEIGQLARQTQARGYRFTCRRTSAAST